jgi:hypothetical protein
MTCVLDLEGIALEQLVAFIALFFYSILLTYFVAYAAEVFFSSSPVGFSCSDGCTRGFFTSGSAGCASSCCTVPVVEFFLPNFGFSIVCHHAEVLSHLVEFLIT